MLVYRNDEDLVDARSAWRTLVRRADALTQSSAHDEVTALLIETGEIESAVVDRLAPERDGCHPLAAGLRLASLAAGRLFIASWRSSDDVPAALHALRTAFKRIPQESLPGLAARRVSEGYAYYALHPETYSVAARRFWRSAKPSSAVCIGIRSIGTSLSAVVAATLAESGVPVRLLSVRPRGHPFARQLRLDGVLKNLLASEASAAHYVVVDEGPGLSGSSFACVTAALTELGVPGERIALFPSWNADGTTFCSAAARTTWARHARYVVAHHDAGVGIERIAPRDGSREWSAGAWRQHLLPCEADWPAVHPQHERVKRFVPDAQETVRFAGLGSYGTRTMTRATMLAGAGFGPEPRTLESGYLRLPFVSGEVCSRNARDVLAIVPRYLAFLVRCCAAGHVQQVEVLHHMIETNCCEADESIHVPSLDSFGGAIHDAQATAIDGRMLAHEFVRTGAGMVKMDALDHSSDHFFPGAADIAWDLATAEIELCADPHASAELVDQYVQLSRDTSLPARMPFYRLAYAAFQLGYATMARQSLGDSPDGRRFDARRVEFLALLRRLTAR